MPEVSVIVNCLNGERYLRRAIDSIYGQSFTDWEIIFYDNASTDGSAAIAKSYDDKLRYICGNDTVPLGKARNLAMKEAQGNYIGFLDCDDIWMKHKLDRQLPLFRKDDRIGLVFSNAILFFESNGSYMESFEYHRLTPPRGDIFGPLLKRYFIPMPTVILRRDVLLSMDEWFDSAFQNATDYDFFLRIAAKWRCDYVNEPLALYRLHGSSWGETKFREIPVELALTLEKLKREPGILERYQREIEINSRFINFQKAKCYWRDGNGREARKELARNMLGLNSVALLLLSFFRYGWIIKCWEQVHSLKRKKVDKKVIDDFVQDI